MAIAKDNTVSFFKDRIDHKDKAERAHQEPRNKVDTDKDAGVLHRFDINPGELIGKLRHLVGVSGLFGKDKEANLEGPRWSAGSSGFADLKATFEAGPAAERYEKRTGPSGFADLQAGFEAGPAAEAHDERRGPVHKAHVVGAAIIAAAVFAASGSAALFAGWPRGGGDNPPERRGVLERKSAVASDATPTPATPSSAADTEPPPVPATDPVAIPGTPARPTVPGRPFSTSSDSAQVPSASSPPSGAPEPPAPVAQAPSAPPPTAPSTTAPSPTAPPGSSGLHQHPGRGAQ